MERALYFRAYDGSWWEGRPREGLLYILEPGERWELLDDGTLMVVHPDRLPKVVYPDGRVEEIAPSEKANAISAKTTTPAPIGRRPRNRSSQPPGSNDDLDIDRD